MIPVVTPVIVPERKCPRCGGKVGGSDSSCPRCGATLPKLGRNNLLVVLGLVLALIGGVVAFLLHS